MTTCHFNLPLILPSPHDGATRLVQLAGKGMKGEGPCEIYATLELSDANPANSQELNLAASCRDHSRPKFFSALVSILVYSCSFLVQSGLPV